VHDWIFAALCGGGGGKGVIFARKKFREA